MSPGQMDEDLVFPSLPARWHTSVVSPARRISVCGWPEQHVQTPGCWQAAETAWRTLSCISPSQLACRVKLLQPILGSILVLLVKTPLSLVTVMYFRRWGSPLRAAARYGVLPLQCVVVPGAVPASAPGGEKVRKLLPWFAKLWWV